jgi:DnaJ domain
MLYLIGGFAILLGMLLLVYVFVNADPVRLARNLKWTGIVIAGLAVLALIVTQSARLFEFLIPLAMVAPLLGRLRWVIDRFRPATAGRRSTVTTDYLRMSLDHDTGAMTGTVLRGNLAGLRVEGLGLPDLLALLRECRVEDERGARLLEAYLDRVHPDWREAMGSAEATGARGGGSSAMTEAEAYAILGLSPGADAEAVKDAHRRLMMKLHPDHGGTDYLATQINRARDLLLRGR